tara:strand:+ start:977 stop:1213 length:237 start_codon:yes stop_codon:yes gene_type:complete
MRYLILITIFLFPYFVFTKDIKIYNAHGKLIFTISKDGKIFNPYGKFQGRTDTCPNSRNLCFINQKGKLFQNSTNKNK